MVPPHSFEAEEAILGCLVIEGRTALDRIAPQLVAEDFFIESHRLVYADMISMQYRDEPVDLITLQEQMRRADHLTAIGGPSKLALLLERGSVAAYLDRYVSIVVVFSNYRRMWQIGQRLLTVGQEAKDDIRDLLDESLRALGDLRARVV